VVASTSMRGTILYFSNARTLAWYVELMPALPPAYIKAP
jgi:hypothetical protein